MLMLVLSLVLGLIPLAGIVLIALAGWLATVDGLFTSLILAAISGVFFLNALLEARALGLPPFGKRPATNSTTSTAAPRPAATRAASGPPTAPPPANAEGVVTETGVVEGVRLYEMPVGYADKSLVSFRAEGSHASRPMVFCGNVQHLRAGRKIRISYKPSPDGNQLLAWE